MSYAPHAPAPVTPEKAVEVLETKELRAKTASAPAVVQKKISIAPLLRKLGFTAVGVTLTAKNTRMEQMKGGRATNEKIAEHLAGAIRELLGFLNILGVACFLTWVYEKHENGSPHAHAIAFIPQALKEHVAEKIAEYLGGGEAISRTPRTAYLLKQLTHSRRVKLDLGRKTKYSEDGNKRYECAKIKGVQDAKKIRYAQNSTMSRNFKETSQKLKELMTKIDEYQRRHRTGKRRKAHTAIRKDDVTLFDFVLYPTSPEENKAQARAKTRARAKETAEAKRLKIGEIDENGEIRISKHPKKRALDVHLRSKNGEKLHLAGKNIYVDAEDVAQIKRKCQKIRGKKQMTKLALVWKSQKSQKIKNEGGSTYDETFFMSLDFEQIATTQSTSEPPKIT